MACLAPLGHWLHAAAIKALMEFQGIASVPLGLPAHETKTIIWASNIWMCRTAL